MVDRRETRPPRRTYHHHRRTPSNFLHRDKKGLRQPSAEHSKSTHPPSLGGATALLSVRNPDGESWWAKMRDPRKPSATAIPRWGRNRPTWVFSNATHPRRSGNHQPYYLPSFPPPEQERHKCALQLAAILRAIISQRLVRDALDCAGGTSLPRGGKSMIQQPRSLSRNVFSCRKKTRSHPFANAIAAGTFAIRPCRRFGPSRCGICFQAGLIGYETALENSLERPTTSKLAHARPLRRPQIFRRQADAVGRLRPAR